MESLDEIKKEREYVPEFMYIQRLEDFCERLETALLSIYKFTLPCETNYENHINNLAKEALEIS